MDLYRKYEAEINSILNRQVLVDFNEQDIKTLTSIQTALNRDDKLAEAIMDAKKNGHLKDQSVKKQRSKLISKGK